jgi:uncharacterized protein YbjT (DUF2867 family)
VKRYVSVSALGASTGLSTRSMDDEMKDYYKQKRAAGRHIVNSDLDWTIVEPAELTEEEGTGKVTASLGALDGEPISRADVAAMVLATLSEPRSIGKAIEVTGGNTAIKTALKQALA